MAGLAENRWKLLYMAGNNWKQLKLLQVAGYGKKWLKMARNDFIWLECENSLITFSACYFNSNGQPGHGLYQHVLVFTI